MKVEAPVVGGEGGDEYEEEDVEGESVGGVRTVCSWDLRLVEESGDAGGLGRTLVAPDWIGD